MDRYTRHELKQDEFRSVYHEFEHFTRTRYKEILGVAGAIILVAGLGLGLKLYSDRQEAEANTGLGAALRTFRAYVGPPSPNLPADQSFPSPQEKYKKALGEFREVTQKHPHQKAAAIARYHVGICQAALGDHAGAIKTLEEAARASDGNIAPLAKLALADEYTSVGRLPDAEKLYQYLADHPTLEVPKTTALMALAGADRATNPAKSRKIYEGLLADKNLGTNASLVTLLKEQMSDLPK